MDKVGQAKTDEDNRIFHAILDERERLFREIIASSDEEEEEECTKEDIEMEVATHQHVQTFEVQAPSPIPLEDTNLGYERTKTLEPWTYDQIQYYQTSVTQVYQNVFLCNDEEQDLDDSPKDGTFFSDFINEMLDEEHKDSPHLSPSCRSDPSYGQVECDNFEPPKDKDYVQLNEVYVDPFSEQPCKEEDNSSKDYLGDGAHKHIEELQDCVLIQLETCVEDPFLITLPQDKFRSFHPFISRPSERSSHNPLIWKGTKCMKGLWKRRKVHCRLDGRKAKWDLKVV